ncbi:MAG: UDP-N-acetylglucosamine 2-epimerase (non-hydrolyzing), partial [Nitrospirae bacterium]|nr:UDP-N-acetylglucosamine 2-epimerase (non-hydrolyzing) [Nitrospirota bacterium]
MKVLGVVGARPNFMKMAPVLDALRGRDGVETFLVHTGQHYDERMSALFFDQLGLPRPDVDLGVGSGPHAAQTADVMKRIDPVLEREAPDVVIVVGDVNSTLAAALAAVKRGIPVAHVEAGLRSFDRTMPEEINRVLTDQISDLLFVTERPALANLVREGIPVGRVHFVGNAMIDTLLKHRDRAGSLDMPGRLGLGSRRYGVVTLHRPSNVDDPVRLAALADLLAEFSWDLPLVFPVHPRTEARMRAAGLAEKIAAHPGLRLTAPLGYLEFLGLVDGARAVLTDSGGIQE